MKAILKNHSDFSVDEKIETLIKFHKDTCANVFLKLYPSTGGGGDARQDLQILKDFERVLVEIQLEYRKTYLEGSYHQFTSMLEFLKSPDAASYPEDFKMTLEKLGCVEDKGYLYHNDEERLETFQKLGVDMCQYQDDSVGYEQYFNGQPTQAEILEHYKLLEKEATRTSDKVAQLIEDAQPTNRYLQDIERHVVFMEMALTTGTLFLRTISL
ncbi:hypothetical protein MKW94_026122 [Papaver nudicaule]|uniref:Uncharacterized protein n=1 Tax=Papaver nudicaule TaxID=74823 RepID=A0AA41V8A0_PAPNU|nr:hypothetical protein [Papaver nudicaule]